jgi:calcineurin-like phosphoesterase family protein
MRKTYLLSDSHLNHEKIKTYCVRPDDFTERIDKNVRQTVKDTDTLIHLGDVGIHHPEVFMKTVAAWPGKKILVRGNHDQKSCSYYMDNGFDFACDALIYRSCWLTHKPASFLPEGTHLNIHGHLHNVWDGFVDTDPEKKNDEFMQATTLGHLLHPWQRLFAVEYTNYGVVEFDKFTANTDNRYKSMGPKGLEFIKGSK